MIDQEKEERLKKRREVYKVKNSSRDLTRKQKRCAHERDRYASMQPDQKRARIEKSGANRALRCNFAGNESIALENPAYVVEDLTSVSPSIMVTRQRKPVTAGERHALRIHQNNKFMKKRRTSNSGTSTEDVSMIEGDTNH